MKKVVKFGGSSLASAEQFRKVRSIIKADPERRFVVPSAPGKRSKDDEKVTDMLYACYALAEEGGDFAEKLAAIRVRYEEIIQGLSLKLSLDEEFKTIEDNFRNRAGKDYAASRGEYLNGIIMAAYLKFPFVDAAEVIFFDENGSFDDYKTNQAMAGRLEQMGAAVIPGFYGSMPDGSIRTFSRGGSDITGSIVSRAVHAEVYENWTDVSGFLIADPRIIPNPVGIDTITYKELRELSYMGAGVLHEDAIFPVRKEGIPINIRNTNAPEDKGTWIVESTCQKSRFVITGIAGKKDYSIVTITKNGLSSAVGELKKILEAFENQNVAVEYVPSGIDSVSLVVDSGKISDCLYSILGELQKKVKPDHIKVTDQIAVVAAVGRKMAFRPGVSGKIFERLGRHGISIRMISQGPDEMNIIVGVDNKDYAEAIRVLYNSFVK